MSRVAKLLARKAEVAACFRSSLESAAPPDAPVHRHQSTHHCALCNAWVAIDADADRECTASAAELRKCDLWTLADAPPLLRTLAGAFVHQERVSELVANEHALALYVRGVSGERLLLVFVYIFDPHDAKAHWFCLLCFALRTWGTRRV